MLAVPGSSLFAASLQGRVWMTRALHRHIRLKLCVQTFRPMGRNGRRLVSIVNTRIGTRDLQYGFFAIHRIRVKVAKYGGYRIGTQRTGPRHLSVQAW
jgi:hypothetical protein